MAQQIIIPPQGLARTCQAQGNKFITFHNSFTWHHLSHGKIMQYSGTHLNPKFYWNSIWGFLRKRPRHYFRGYFKKSKTNIVQDIVTYRVCFLFFWLVRYLMYWTVLNLSGEANKMAVVWWKNVLPIQTELHTYWDMRGWWWKLYMVSYMEGG